MTVKEIAARMCVHKMTVYRLIHSEELRATKFGSQYLVDRSYFDEYLTANTTGGHD